MALLRLVLILLCLLEATTAQTTENSLTILRQRVRLLDRKLMRANRRLRKLDTLASEVAKFSKTLSRFADDPPCPGRADGFFLSEITGSCYHLEPSTVMTNWTDADAICRRLSSAAHLVSIESEAEQRLLATKWRNEIGIATFGRFWTSGKKTANVWKWSSSNTRFNYTNWMPLVPQDDAGFRCAAVYSSEGYTWSGVACWAPHLVTCEINRS